MTGRDRPDTQESFRKMNESFDRDQHRPFLHRFFNFQVFASTLLIVLVIITGTAFWFAMESERDTQVQTEARRELFENHVVDILSSIEDSTKRGIEERNEMENLIRRIEIILEEHAEDGRLE